jgi:hypothetical protein
MIKALSLRSIGLAGYAVAQEAAHRHHHHRRHYMSA